MSAPEPVLVSLSEAAIEFGCDRRRLRAYLAAHAKPAGTRAGHAVWRLRDLLPMATAVLLDVETLGPVQRLAHFRAVNLRAQLEKARDLLVLREAAEAELDRVRDVITRHAGALPATIARELAPHAGALAVVAEQVDKVLEHCRAAALPRAPPTLQEALLDVEAPGRPAPVNVGQVELFDGASDDG